ncbi:D-alanyl-D-alanine carboxypeptidase (penicillin-binding protein 5/6) [Butyrivibrio sp. ob235]|uniref:D-alanyl-D-alanine carboxypeptidase family protein n=1 Tax=Butyrivibrio sp. ob235 TaxID=1761780 RepID=UPI0008D5AEB8|nr:D-alanyl-D-alanine carboxypeptidase family protein [Butyrivibrio sp. ob235]SEL65417.1 D-alanyl-D-alanine carboxypeptidase (penicillin-binding protein 5/6) [Butyrivibrio sp. ob235]
MNYKGFINKLNIIISMVLISVLLTQTWSFCHAETDLEAAQNARKELPIQSNDTPGWPAGPQIGAEAAILMDANTGTILYAKNIHEELYPASTTKIMTCLLAVENAGLNDRVDFSYEAIHSVPADGSKIGMDAGEYLSLEECLYGIMVGSANEVANAVAEHVSGSIDGFIDLMNEKAASLGCTNTHFSNTNGLQASDHYTSAYDLALISSEFFSNELLCRVGNTPRYHFEPSAGQPDDFYLNNKHKLISGEMSYPGIIGGKTGYTDLARETLVTCAERGGMKLVCVVFMEESPSQFTDTVTLFDYGFNNFITVNIKSEESGYIPRDNAFFSSGNDIFKAPTSVLEFGKSDYVILPVNSSLSDATSTVSYDNEDGSSNVIATINYSFNDVPIGSGHILVSQASSSQAASEDRDIKTIYLNMKQIITYFAFAGFSLILLIYISSLISTYSFGGSREDRKRLNRRKREARKRSGPKL